MITHKTNGCNRTDGSAKTHAILASILVTCRQRVIAIIDFLPPAQLATAPAVSP